MAGGVRKKLIRWLCSEATHDSGATSQPIRHPGIRNSFEKLLITSASGSNCSAVTARLPYSMPW